MSQRNEGDGGKESCRTTENTGQVWITGTTLTNKERKNTNLEMHEGVVYVDSLTRKLPAETLASSRSQDQAKSWCEISATNVLHTY